MPTVTSVIPPFPQFAYERPALESLRTDFETALAAFTAAGSAAGQIKALEQIYALRNQYQTMYNIGHIRHTADTRDDFYEQENNFFDEAGPQFDELKSHFYRALLDSPFRAELQAHLGDQLFDIAELSLKVFSPEIISDLQEENRLSSAYNKLKATAQIEFEGEIYNLSSLHVKELDPDRDTRRRAATAKWDWMAQQAPEMERIFDEMVTLRDGMARRLGFGNFVEMGYARMLRTDYSAADVAVFRDQVARHIVPLATRLYEAQARRLGLDDLHHYDESLLFPEGNPQPQGSPEWSIEQAGGMYRELSEETDEFFHFMRRNELMDLVARDGKATGGYCTFIPGYGAPFIFSNFNGTSGDIDVLTHEAGHAFQVYESRHIAINEYTWPTYEACEIHSMSMEFFTWPWMDRFFGDQVDRYRYGHLASALTFLPYGVAVDEFQHFVYENPGVSPAERNAAWRRIEEKYLPHRRYAGHAFLEQGGFWQKQSHIFSVPFYYIDYTLAQICAFQFWLRDQADHASAWNDYLRLCQAGGSKPFLQLVKLANLRSPFDPGCVREVAGAVSQWLDDHQM
ncbi:MAG: M3 family oligoendopeptidase [Lewinella sp.]|nr:M3 family oligoendopeptidase [Lewinella sp.]